MSLVNKSKYVRVYGTDKQYQVSLCGDEYSWQASTAICGRLWPYSLCQILNYVENILQGQTL